MDESRIQIINKLVKVIAMKCVKELHIFAGGESLTLIAGCNAEGNSYHLCVF